MRHAWQAAWLSLILLACGSGTLTISQYATQAQQLVAELETQFDALDAEWESQAPTLEGAEHYWEGRLAVRTEFLDGVRALDPPSEVEDLHATAVDLFASIEAADRAVAARVATFETITEHWQWVDTPEGQAADAILEEVFAFCRASQAGFDATRQRESLDDVPWLPSEASEVVSVAFGCPAEGG